MYKQAKYDTYNKELLFFYMRSFKVSLSASIDGKMVQRGLIFHLDASI